MMIERFSIECGKTKTKVTTLGNHKGRIAIHCPIKTQSNYTKRGKTCTVAFGFTSGWLRKWREFFTPITERSNAKPKQTRITFDTQVKMALMMIITLLMMT